MKTIEQKAEEYAKNYTKSDIGMGEKFRTAKHFIAGYNMRDGESQEIIGALQDLMVMFELIRETCNTSLGDIAYKKAELAITKFTTTP